MAFKAKDWTEVDAAIRVMRGQDMTRKDIAKALGVLPSTVERRLRVMDLPARTAGARAKYDWSGLDPQIVAMYHEELPRSEIAARLDVNFDSLLLRIRYLLRHGAMKREKAKPVKSALDIRLELGEEALPAFHPIAVEALRFPLDNRYSFSV